jgi:hypothetical protein
MEDCFVSNKPTTRLHATCLTHPVNKYGQMAAFSRSRSIQRRMFEAQRQPLGWSNGALLSHIKRNTSLHHASPEESHRQSICVIKVLACAIPSDEHHQEGLGVAPKKVTRCHPPTKPLSCLHRRFEPRCGAENPRMWFGARRRRTTLFSLEESDESHEAWASCSFRKANKRHRTACSQFRG